MFDSVFWPPTLSSEVPAFLPVVKLALRLMQCIFGKDAEMLILLYKTEN